MSLRFSPNLLHSFSNAETFLGHPKLRHEMRRRLFASYVKFCFYSCCQFFALEFEGGVGLLFDPLVPS